MLPAVLVALDYYPLRRWSWRTVTFEKIPYYAVALTIAIVGIKATAGAQADNPFEMDFLQKMARSSYSIVFYMVKSVWPVGLMPHYAVEEQILQLYTPRYLLCLLGVLLITALAFRARGKRPYLWVAWICYLAMLLPVMGLVQHGSLIAAADRYSYMSTIPFFALVGGLVASRIQKERSRIKRAAFLLAPTMILLGLTTQYVKTWKNTETLWSHTLKHRPANSFACNNLGHWYINKRRYAKAADVLERCQALAPRNMRIVLNYGYALEMSGQLRRAAVFYEQALKRSPGHPLVHNNLGVVFIKLGEKQRAEHHLRRALEGNPGLAVAERNLNMLLREKGKAKRAPLSW